MRCEQQLPSLEALCGLKNTGQTRLAADRRSFRSPAGSRLRKAGAPLQQHAVNYAPDWDTSACSSRVVEGDDSGSIRRHFVTLIR